MLINKRTLSFAFALLSAAGLLQAADSTLTLTAPSTLTYVRGKGAGTGLQGSAPKITATVASMGTKDTAYIVVDTTRLPDWAILDKSNATITGNGAVTFTLNPSPLAASLAPGTYWTEITVKATFSNGTNASTKNVTAAILVKTAPTQISATTPTIAWAYGATELPAAKIIVTSSDGDPVGFTATVAGVSPTGSWVTLSESTGIANSWGETIALTFAQSAFDNAIQGTPLKATVTIKGPNNTVAVPISIAVNPPGEEVELDLKPFTPTALPVVSSGTSVRTVAVSGTNFYPGMEVKVGNGAALKNDCAGFAAVTSAQALCIQSSARFFLKLKEATDLNVAGNLVISAAGKTSNLKVTTAPIIYGVANSASYYTANNLGAYVVAPYEMITFTGENFAKAGTAALNVPLGSGRYPNTVNDTVDDITVLFSRADDPDGNLKDGQATLLAVTPTQIIALVPSTILSGDEVKVLRGAAASDALAIERIPAAPGIFVNDDGSAVAINNATGLLNNSTNTAKAGDDITIYATGLGAPDSTGDPANDPPGQVAYPGSCIAPAKYLAELQAGDNSIKTMDGFSVSNTVAAATKAYLPPCFDPATVTVALGGAPATVKYAGWVNGDVAGYYTIIATVPAVVGMTPTSTGAASYSAVVTVGGEHSTTSPFVWVK